MLQYITAGSVSPDDGEHCCTPALTGTGGRLGRYSEVVVTAVIPTGSRRRGSARSARTEVSTCSAAHPDIVGDRPVGGRIDHCGRAPRAQCRVRWVPDGEGIHRDEG
jgi:hypothetical protein